MKKYLAPILALALLIAVISWMGVGYRPSGSAVEDLKDQLVALHGEPYTGREVEGGTESMEISVEPDTFFPSNYSFRYLFNLDYRYRCEVTYTVRQGDEIIRQRTIAYVGRDPVGSEKTYIRVYLETK